MLCKKNLILIIDTGILKDILLSGKPNMQEALQDWFEQTVCAMECNSTGKEIVVVTSRKLQKEYLSVLNRGSRKYPKTVIELVFGRPPTKRSIWKERKIYLKIKQINPLSVTRSKVRDEEDWKLVALIKTVQGTSSWKHHHVIIATKDTETYDDLQCELLARSNTDVVDTMQRLEDMIKC